MCESVRVCAHVYVFDLPQWFHVVATSLLFFKYLNIYIYICINMSSSIVKEATTFEMELRGHKQATAHSHAHTKNSNPSKKIFATTKFEFESAN